MIGAMGMLVGSGVSTARYIASGFVPDGVPYSLPIPSEARVGDVIVIFSPYETTAPALEREWAPLSAFAWAYNTSYSHWRRITSLANISLPGANYGFAWAIYRNVLAVADVVDVNQSPTTADYIDFAWPARAPGAVGVVAIISDRDEAPATPANPNYRVRQRGKNGVYFATTIADRLVLPPGTHTDRFATLLTTFGQMGLGLELRGRTAIPYLVTAPASMTGHNAPLGYQVLTSGDIGGNPAWKAFDYADSSTSHYWLGSAPGWAQIRYPSERKALTYEIKASHIGGFGPTTFSLQGSLDGINFTVIDTRLGEPTWTFNEIRTYTIQSPGAYYIYRLDVAANVDNPGVVRIHKLTFTWDDGTTIPFPVDIQPDSFEFTDVTGAAISTVYTSNAITVAGIEAASPIIVANGEYSVNGGAWTSASATVVVSDQVRVRGTSPSVFSDAIGVILTIGGVSDIFSIATASAAATPDAFTFTDVTGAALSTEYESNEITVNGITTSVAVTVTGGQYSKNGAAYTSAAGTAASGDNFRVKGMSSGSFGTALNIALTIGGVSDTYSVTTPAADPWATAVPVILDFDYGGDVDDAFLLSILMGMHKQYLIKLVAVIVSITQTKAAPAVRAVLDTYAVGHPAAALDLIPVYANQGATGGGSDSYATEVLAKFGTSAWLRTTYRMATGQTTRTALDGYRKHLAAEPAGSVRIITAGGFTALSELLQSAADGYSALNGTDLVAAKVSLVQSMGGNYPSIASEVNIGLDPTAATYVAAHIPVNHNWNGSGSGYTVNVGPTMFTDPNVDPTAYAAAIYAPSTNYYVKRGFDPAAGVIGLADLLGLTNFMLGGGTRGTQTITGSGTSWSASPVGFHAYHQTNNMRPAMDMANSLIDSMSLGPVAQPSVTGMVVFALPETSGGVFGSDAEPTFKGYASGRTNDAAAGLPASTGLPLRGATGYLDFDGTNDFAAVPQPASALFEAENFVWGCVVEFDDVTGERALISNNYAAADRSVSLGQSATQGATGLSFMNNGGALRVFAVYPSGSVGNVTASIGLTTATKYLLMCIVQNKRNVALYNGDTQVTAGFVALSNDIGVTRFADNPILIGAHRSRTAGNGVPTAFFNGRMYSAGFGYGFTSQADGIAMRSTLATALRAKALSVHGVTV